MQQKLAHLLFFLFLNRFCCDACPCPLPVQVLALVSPYSWLPGWTPQDKWLGGYTGRVRGAGLVAGLVQSVLLLCAAASVLCRWCRGCVETRLP